MQAKESGIKDGVGMTEDDEKLLAEDDDELDLDDEELDELEAGVSKTSLHDTWAYVSWCCQLSHNMVGLGKLQQLREGWKLDFPVKGLPFW